jgi:hypothetical protein
VTDRSDPPVSKVLEGLVEEIRDLEACVATLDQQATELQARRAAAVEQIESLKSLAALLRQRVPGDAPRRLELKPGQSQHRILVTILTDRARWWRVADVVESSGLPPASVRTMLRRLVEAELLDADKKLGYRAKDGVTID